MSDSMPPALVELIGALNCLPGVGPRSAERMALFLIQSDDGKIKQISDSMLSAKERIGFCGSCGGITEIQPCKICSNESRSASQLCLVEQAVDIISFERSGSFVGKYHVLGGKISPLNGVGPEDLRLREFENRIRDDGVEEVIIALGSDVEGDATSYFIAERLREKNVRVSRLAQGLPVGSALEYADELTLSRALEGRTSI